jgi:hypothetical protein
MVSKFLSSLVNTVNAYYSFALIIYVAFIYATRHNHFFIWIIIAATLSMAAWGGYTIHSLMQQRIQRYGFRTIKDSMTYDVSKPSRHILRYSTEIKAEADHLFVYPIAHQWTGSGAEEMPTVSEPGQQVLAQVNTIDKAEGPKVGPYRLTMASGGEWQYWFVAFNPPMQKGDTALVKYSQAFNNADHTAKPCLYYYVSRSMARLELTVKFPPNEKTKAITAHFFKPSDNRRPFTIKDAHYDPDNHTANWVIDHPKKGYCYQINW